MFFYLTLFIVMLSSQAFADATNHFAGYTGTSAINAFQTVEVNGNVGIGTATPSSNLSVYSLTYPSAITLNSSLGPGNDSSTILLLHLNNSVTDSSFSPFTVTNNNATFSNSSPKFSGTYYGVFNGTNAYLSVPNASSLNFGSGDFTIDFWFEITTLPGNGTIYQLFEKSDTGGNNGYVGYVTNTSGTYQIRILGLSGGSNIADTGLITITPIVNTWYHFAWVRSGSTWTTYWNGSSIATATSSSSLGTNTSFLSIGSGSTNNTPQNYSAVNISEFRISNIARWTSNFTPPVVPYGNLPVSQIVFQDTSVQKAKVWLDVNDSDKLKIDDGTATRLTVSGGNVGIGSTNPSALLDVSGSVRLQTGLITTGTAPTVSSGAGDCGTSPSVTGNDISGTVSVGSGANGGKCTVTFSTSKSSTPNCICQNSTTANLAYAASQSTTGFACTGALTAGDKLVYWCPQ